MPSESINDNWTRYEGMLGRLQLNSEYSYIDFKMCHEMQQLIKPIVSNMYNGLAASTYKLGARRRFKLKAKTKAPGRSSRPGPSQ